METITLFEKLGRTADGFQFEQVIDAGLNLVINALRQSHSSQDKAEKAWDEMIAKAKDNLINCYDSTGRPKAVYPFKRGN